MPALIPRGKLNHPFSILRPQVDVDASGFCIVCREVQIAEIGNPRNGIEKTYKANGDLLRPGYALLFKRGGQRTAFCGE